MVQQNLVDYVKRLLSQGYTPAQIRTTLQNAGYSNYDTEEALSHAGASKHIVTPKFLVILFIIFFILIIGILIALKSTQSAPIELALSLSLFTQELSAGQELTLSADITSIGTKPVSANLQYIVRGPEGNIATKTQPFTITDQTSIPLRIAIPTNAVPGDYDARITVTYGAKIMTKSASFTVKEGIAPTTSTELLAPKQETQAQIAQQTCPHSCDDFNFCTQDSCVNGNCVSTPITPCCGNKQCENTETETSCPLDCAAQKPSPDAIRSQAQNLATSNMAEAINTCNSLGQQNYIDNCLSQAAQTATNKAACEAIVSDEQRDACYLSFSYKGDSSVCAKITSELYRNSCEQLVQVQQTQANVGQ